VSTKNGGITLLPARNRHLESKIIYALLSLSRLQKSVRLTRYCDHSLGYENIQFAFVIVKLPLINANQIVGYLFVGLQKNNDPHSLKNKLITSMRYKIIALLCALSIIGLIITLLALFAREDGFIIKASLIAACILITIYAINKGANLDNAALLKSLNTNKFVWATHRGPSTVIDFKINNRTLQPYGVFASSKFQRILGKTF